MIIKNSIKELLELTIQLDNDEFKNQKIKEYKGLLELIDFIIDNELTFNSFSNIIKIPKSSTDFSEYRLIDDTDTENRDFWIDTGIKLNEGDIILELKK
ncbi:hypothetical protein [Faecalibacter sp. LW9]|uniref:hypothetical protein n=1 Tax=Faecalibacter sp. LW9 TaxID=3103144 RepID=UPI002AFF2ED2|nr:hypothetical protein [Faecalibacter sp. LW9]